MKMNTVSIVQLMWIIVIIIIAAETSVEKWRHAQYLREASKSFSKKQGRKKKKTKRIEITPNMYLKIYDRLKTEVCQHLTKQRVYSEIAYTKTRIQNNLNADEPIWKSLLFAISCISLLQSTISSEDENNATAMLIIGLLIVGVIAMAAFYFWNQSYGNYIDQIIRFQCDMLESIKRECDEGLLEKRITIEIDANNKTDTGSWNIYDYLTGQFTTNALKELQSEELEDKKRAESKKKVQKARLNSEILPCGIFRDQRGCSRGAPTKKERFGDPPSPSFPK